MNDQILFPNEVTAYRIGNEPSITIIARGQEDGFCKIKIAISPAAIVPPIFMALGEPCIEIGLFPYTVQLTVPYSTNMDHINFQMADGTRNIPVVDVMKQQKNLPNALVKLTDKQVVGYAYNSSDSGKATQDAVNKLQKNFPGQVNAKIIESGFVAAGLPVGIAFFYVVMEQQ